MGCSASKATAADAMEEQPVRPAPTEDSAHAHKPLDAGSASFAKHAVNQVEVQAGSLASQTAAAELGPPAAAADKSPAWEAPLPDNDAERVAVLHALDMADRPMPPESQQIVELVAHICEMPVAAICILAGDTTVIKASVSPPGTILPSTWKRSQSIISWGLQNDQPEVLLVEDLTKDTRFCDHAIVTEYKVQCYVGVPLVTSSGHTVGSLFMVDVKPRQLPRECCQLLCNMCELLMRQYERQSSEVVHAAYASHSESANLNAAVLVVEVETPGWPIRYANAAWQDLAGKDSRAVLERGLWEVFGRGEANRLPVQAALFEDMPCTVTAPLQDAVGRPDMSLFFRPAATTRLDNMQMPIVIPGDIPRCEPEIAEHLRNYCLVTITPAESKSSKVEFVHRPRTAAGPPIEGLTITSQVSNYHVSGRVYLGLYKAQPATVMVSEYRLEDIDYRSSEDCPAVLLHKQLSHPILAPLLVHGSRLKPAAKTWRRRRASLLKGVMGGPEVTIDPNSNDVLELCLVVPRANRGPLDVVIDHGRLVAGTQDGRLVLNMVLLLRFAAQLASLVAAVHALGMIFGYISSRSLGLNVEGSQSDHDIEDASLWVQNLEYCAEPITEPRDPTIWQGDYHFAAPEVLGQGLYLKASDVYSFGALLWSMCSGQMPWMGLSREEVTTQLGVEHRTLEFRDGFPPVLVTLARRCMSFQPEARPSIGQLQHALKVLQAIADAGSPAAWNAEPDFGT